MSRAPRRPERKKADGPPKPRRFGWCNDGNHPRCRVSYVSTMGVHEGQVIRCSCPCHAENQEAAA